MGDFNLPFVTISSGSRNPIDESGFSSGDSAYGSSLGDKTTPPATHDISRVNYHVKHLSEFARALEDSASRAFPNRGGSQRYKAVHALLLLWDSDDLFVLPELQDLETCLQQDFNFETERFKIPSDNAHLDLMLKIGAMIKEHESTDTLLIVYYGGHARIDDARQSTWCAAAFPNGNSITETISASSWDAIAPEPGRFSFTSTLIEVLQEWTRKTFSAAMLHAEILARLKHPRPERRNGSHIEARTTPVHFMMTANHRAPSIELCKISPAYTSPSLPFFPTDTGQPVTTSEGRSSSQEIVGSEPTQDTPHVMISLALEGDQNLNIDEWERWLANTPGIAKYVQVQGIFKSHSTLLLLSLPVMVWDMLPDDMACSFIAFIRSNNLASEANWKLPLASVDTSLGTTDLESDRESLYTEYSGTTAFTEHLEPVSVANWSTMDPIQEYTQKPTAKHCPPIPADHSEPKRPLDDRNMDKWVGSPSLLSDTTEFASKPGVTRRTSNLDLFLRPPDLAARTRSSRPLSIGSSNRTTKRRSLPLHVQKRLEELFLENPFPTVSVTEFLASTFSIETADVDNWFRQRREQQEVSNGNDILSVKYQKPVLCLKKLQSLRMDDQSRTAPANDGARMILAGHLNKLLEMFPTGQIVIIDLRSRADYQRSHIHGAINFRAPASFVSRASLEMIEKALLDDASRSSFNKWYTSKCVVFYDKCVEYPWEAPVAEAFFQKFKSKDWTAQCFVLKGHYREFSQSFDKYIVGTATTDKATEYLASLRDVSWEKSKDDHQRYDSWLALLDGEDRVHTTELAPAVKTERMQATVAQQQSLEAEFERSFPYLAREAKIRKPDNNWSVKAPMIAHLERGLAKMQHEIVQSRSGAGNCDIQSESRKSYDNWNPVDYNQYPYSEAENDMRFAPTSPEESRFLQHRHMSAPLQHTVHKSPSSSTLKPSDELSTSSAPHDRRGRSSSSGGKNLFTRIIRSGRADAPG
ncbi:hypothetical protein GGR57DRAFT_496390 [Xylariaceae sp. FL1272]|nr:hypothetical protein GGR57DRAFT_496390 [Xylariaceae sp. FL1272]